MSEEIEKKDTTKGDIAAETDEDKSVSEIEPDSEQETPNDQDQTTLADRADIQASLKGLSESSSVLKKYTPESVKNIVEAAILAASKAISLDKLLTLFPEGEIIDKRVLSQAIELLKHDYQDRGIELIEVSSGFRFQVAQSVAPWVARLWEEKPQKYSRALLETLALVAYRQPITRGEIEEIRGVSVSSHIVRTLVEREWIRVIGHRDVPGKPAMYATTRQFLDYFGLKKLDELPSLSEIRDLDSINEELDFGEAAENQDKTEVQNELSLEETTDDDYSQDSIEVLADDELKVDPDIEAEERARINIDAELEALKETYKRIDELEKKEHSDTNPDNEPGSSS
jgi:segregation and condensation protein B